MNKIIFNCWCETLGRAIRLFSITITTPFTTDYVLQFICDTLQSFDPKVCGVFDEDSIPEITINVLDYEVAEVFLIDAFRKLYESSNNLIDIHVDMHQYDHKPDTTLDLLSTGLCVKDSIEYFNKTLKMNLLKHELHTTIYLKHDRFKESSTLQLKVEGFKPVATMQRIVDEELEIAKEICSKNKKYDVGWKDWYIIGCININQFSIPDIVFLEMESIYTYEPFVAAKFLKDVFESNDIKAKITIPKPHMRYMYVELTPQDNKIDSELVSLYTNTIERLRQASLYHKQATLVRKKDYRYEHVRDLILDHPPVFLNTCIDAGLQYPVCTISTDICFVSQNHFDMVKKEIIKRLQDKNIEVSWDDRSNGYIQYGTISNAKEADDIMKSIEDKFGGSMSKEPEYTELTIYPTYVSFFEMTSPDFLPEECSIKVPCKYNVEEENALIVFIHNEFPTLEIMDKNADRMFSGTSGNYTFAVVNKEFSLNIVIKGGYGFPIQSLKESFERHMENYTRLYNVKNSILQKCSNIKWDFTEDYMEGERVINGSVVMRDDEYHVFADFRASDHVKAYIQEACDSIRRTTRKEVFLHEVPLFIIEQINENSVIKTETIDIYVDRKDKNDRTI